YKVITEVKINNFKSVQDLTLPLARFNVLIGSNGSGKSNILEAIAFGGAASADKLDNEFLGSRGIRMSSAQLMKSAFIQRNANLPIHLSFNDNSQQNLSFSIHEEADNAILKWTITEKNKINETLKDFIQYLIYKDPTSKNFANKNFVDTLSEEDIAKLHDINFPVLEGESEKIAFLNTFNKVINNKIVDEIFIENNYIDELAKFIIYSPEISSLRKFDEESQIQPLGVKGEGLFNMLQIFFESYGPETIEEIKTHLHIIDWFDDFETIYDKKIGRKSLVVKDRYISGLTLNQTNVNEGFLFLLFYISLLVSKDTPSFFAIDNIEASFHPRLCKELIKNLILLSKKHNKQIILTTHNPFVLDGLDLDDSEQKLFVVRRNSEGETIADSVDQPIKNVKLSEAWMRGYIGGQPETI
ncbi:MAG: AAA family ATPase, partial [Bacteriovorax sp.]